MTYYSKNSKSSPSVYENLFHKYEGASKYDSRVDLSLDRFTVLNQFLIECFGLDKAVLLSHLIGIETYWQELKDDPNYRVYCTDSYLMKRFKWGERKVRKMLSELKKMGYLDWKIDSKHRRVYDIRHDNIIDAIICSQSFREYAFEGEEVGACPKEEQKENSHLSIENLRSLSYSDYLQTDHWNNLRKISLRNSHYRCQLCYTNKEQLDIHHRTYERKGCEYLSDLIVLCHTCHSRHHSSLPKGGT